MLFLLHYNMSVAVWVGLIALAGLDAETGVVMLPYLDHAWEKFKAQGRMNRIEDLYAAVIEGTVHSYQGPQGPAKLKVPVNVKQ
jgi:Cu(I)/Ag(I) efflux system membrane protein CusA/SilA